MSFTFEKPQLDIDKIYTRGGVRVPVCLCLDTSNSMSGPRINKLNAGIKDFKTMLCEDLKARMATDLCIVTFNSFVRCAMDFTPILKAEMPTFTASGQTYLGEAVEYALNMLENRKAFYKQNGYQYNQPILFILSDGDGNGDPDAYARAAERVRNLSANRKLSAYGIAMDTRSNLNELTEITDREALMLDTTKFNEFFVWLSQSVTAIANSGKDLREVDVPSVAGWAVFNK